MSRLFGILPGLLVWLLSDLSVGQPAEVGPRTARGPTPTAARPPSRYISAQAYYHALRAALSEAQGDLETAADELQLALVYDHDSLHLTLELARVNLDLGRIARAHKMAEKAQGLAPRAVKVALLRARVAVAQGRPTVAERGLRRAERRERDGIEAALALARLLMKSGRDQEARPVLRRAADRQPQSIEPLVLLTEVHRSAGRLDRATESLERALRRAPGQRALLLQLTDLYERQGRLEAAAPLWADFVELHPSDREGLAAAVQVSLLLDGAADELLALAENQSRSLDDDRRLGLVLEASGQARAAIPWLKEVVAQRQGDAEATLAYGRALLQVRDRRRGLTVLEGLGPEAASAYVAARERIAQAHLAEGRSRRARQALQAGLRNAPDSAVLTGLLARVLSRQQDAKAATRILDDAQRRDLDPAPLLFAEIEVLERSRGTRAVLARMQVHLRSATGPVPAVRRALARALVRHGQPARAAPVLREALEESPDDVGVLTDLAEQLATPAGEPREAVALARRALARAPRSPRVLDVLGRAHLAAGDVEHARTFLMRAGRLSVEDLEIMEHIGDLERISGDRDAARRAYRGARRLVEAALRARAPGATKTRARLERKLAGLEAK